MCTERVIVKLMIFSSEWIFHVRWWSLDTLPNILYPIFHVRMSTSERRSVNPNSNLIKVVVFAQYLEVGLQWWFSIYWGNITTLMRFELGLTLLLSLVLIRTWNIGYNMLARVSRIINERGIFIQCWKSSIWHSLSKQ